MGARAILAANSAGRQIGQRAVRPVVSAVFAERFEQIARMADRKELGLVETFVVELAVEAFDVAVLERLSWRDEAMVHLPLVHPAFERQAGKLRPVVGAQAARAAGRATA